MAMRRPAPATAPAPMAGLLIYPLADRDGRKMTELVVASPGGRELTLYEADFLEGLALQAAVALENARNHKRNVEFARVQQDLDAARAIQRSLLPQTLPEIPGYSVAFRSDTCYEVGGDYLDIVEQPDGSLLMAVADVAGKGLASAIMSTSFRSAFRAMAATGMPLDELADAHEPAPLGRGRRGAAALRDGDLPAAASRRPARSKWSTPGHNPGFLVAARRRRRVIFEAAGTPLGLLPGMRYASERRGFPPGARLLFYTDGLTEVFKGDEEFGPERLLDEFLTCPAQKADGILDALWAAIEAFCRRRAAGRRHDRTGAVPRGSGSYGDAWHERSRQIHHGGGAAASRMGYEKVAMSTARPVAKLMGFPEDRIEDLKTAVAEACINAIEHGNRLNEKLSRGRGAARRAPTRWK